MDNCTAIAAGLIQGSVSTATWQAYARAWQEWVEVQREVGTECKGDEWGSLVLYFVVKNFVKGVSPASVGRKLAGLAFWFKLEGLEDFTKSFIVRQAMRGYRKGRRVADSRRPVSIPVLQVVLMKLGEVCFSMYEHLLFRVAFLLMFFGAFRIGEVVSPSLRRAGGLSVTDVEISQSTVQVRLRRSKTDQLGKGKVVVLGRGVDQGLCPLWALQSFLDRRPQVGGPLLVHSDGSFLSRFQFVAVFRRCLIAGGFRPSEYASHSFRIGAATEVARWGLGDSLVQRIGRWESNRFRIYVRPHLL